jgi:hypothetical protein
VNNVVDLLNGDPALGWVALLFSVLVLFLIGGMVVDAYDRRRLTRAARKALRPRSLRVIRFSQPR